MEDYYICFCEVIGLTLEKDSSIDCGNFIITNSSEELISLMPSVEEFKKTFGSLHLNKFLNGRVFLVFPVVGGDLAEFQKLNLFYSGILSNLWNIRDNSVFVLYYYYVNIDSTDFIFSDLSFRFYNCKGEISVTTFTTEEIQSLTDRNTKKTIFYSKHIEPWVGNLDGTHIAVVRADGKFQVNRIERAFNFINSARSASELGQKITNYMAFYECLFSTDNTEIGHQISERAAIFLSKYDGANKQQIYNIIKLGYGIRSKFIHGERLQKKSKDLENLREKAEELDEITRRIVNIILENNLDVFDQDVKVLQQFYLDLVLPD